MAFDSQVAISKTSSTEVLHLMSLRLVLILPHGYLHDLFRQAQEDVQKDAHHDHPQDTNELLKSLEAHALQVPGSAHFRQGGAEVARLAELRLLAGGHQAELLQLAILKVFQALEGVGGSSSTLNNK